MIECNFEACAAHCRSLLHPAAGAAPAAVHEGSDTVRSRRAQCEAAPDNPTTRDTYHSRGRSCADDFSLTTASEDIEHQTAPKRIQATQPPLPPWSTRQQAAQHLRGISTTMLLLLQRVAVIVATRRYPRQTRHGRSEEKGVAKNPMER